MGVRTALFRPFRAVTTALLAH